MAVTGAPFVAGKATRDTEQVLIERLLALWRSKIDEVAERLRENSTLPSAYWSKFEERQREAVAPWLTTVVLQGVTEGKRALGIGKAAPEIGIAVDWNLVNDDAVRWAREYSYELVTGITDTTRDRLQTAVGEWLESNEPYPALRTRVAEIFDNPVRAEMIAATEGTRAIAEGNTQAWAAADIPEREWRTAVDELVCPICGPLHQQRAKIGEAFPGNIKNPPAHPNCRCALVPVVSPERSPAPGTGQERRVVAGQERTFNVTTINGVRLLTPVDLDRSRQVIDPTFFEGILKLRERLPESLHTAWQEIIITDERNIALEAAYQDTEYGEGGRIVASAGTEQQITFYPNADLSRDEILDYAGEEIGHLVARELFGSWSPQDEERWYAAMQADDRAPHGTLVNQEEDFAELVGLWLLDHAQARQDFPARVRLLEEWFQAYEQ